MTEEEHHERRVQRFLNIVHREPNSGCWIWGGVLEQSGYGRFKVKKDRKVKTWPAHRWSAKYIGGMDIEDLLVCHKCDNPPCVNPDHLFTGTHADNMADMDKKGRRSPPCLKGSGHGRAKLTEEDIPLIRALIARGIRLNQIAPLFNVAPETIGDIKHNRHWSHVL